jgi:hypothetical protein
MTPATIESIRFRGSHTDYTLASPNGRLIARVGGPPRLSNAESTAYRIRHSWPLADVRLGDEIG